jgi:transposase
MDMTNYREIMRLYWYGLSQRNIAESCNCSKTTVNKVLKRAFETGLRWPLDEEVTNAVIFKKLFGDEKKETNFRMPDYASVHKELAKSGVTLNMLWLEYCHECRLNGETPYMHTQFYKYYQDYVVREKATMHLEHKPGEKMEVDWCGQVVHIADSVTATETNAYVFVAVLPCSGYSYVEAFLTRNLNNWINAHIHAYEYFGGVTKLLICDNLKTGVTQASWYTPEINKTYSEMAEHYGTVVIPARAYHPRDKASVESTVGSVSSFILAALRNNRYYSITEMNIDIRQKLDMFNAKPFQKKPGSRLSAFSDDEYEYLQPLPHSRFEISVWKTAKVQYNYHIKCEASHLI